MARIYGSGRELTERERLESKYNGARTNLLIALGFTLVNLVLLFFDSTSYFLFSLYVPYYIALLGCVLSGKMPSEFYVDEWADLPFLGGSFFAIVLGIVAIILILYVLCWIFSKKNRVGWLICALVFVILDTIATVALLGIAVDSIIDIAFHIWLLVSVIGGVSAHYKWKKIPEEVVETEESLEAETEVGAITVDSTPLRVADNDVKFRTLLEAEHNGMVITYRRVKKANELVINGNVYDEYAAFIEQPHMLAATVSGCNIVAGYDGLNSYIKVDGEIIKKKFRI